MFGHGERQLGSMGGGRVGRWELRGTRARVWDRCGASKMASWTRSGSLASEWEGIPSELVKSETYRGCCLLDRVFTDVFLFFKQTKTG
jgi:hypothetical protein